MEKREKRYLIEDAKRLDLNRKDAAWLVLADELGIHSVLIRNNEGKQYVDYNSVYQILIKLKEGELLKQAIEIIDCKEEERLDEFEQDREERCRHNDYINDCEADAFESFFEGDESNYWNVD